MIRAVVALVRHPSLWLTALRQARRTAAPGWWKRWPFLPLPSGEYLEFRLVTQYGDSEHPPDQNDVVKYLRWCRDWDSAPKG